MLFPGTISSIGLEEPDSWRGAAFLTFDVDWAHDEVLADTIELIEAANVPATWFVTHKTPLVDRLFSNPQFELGIHPNFNWLLEGDTRNGTNALEVVERLMDLVPEAKSVRSHSMTQSSNLLKIFADLGLTHDVNHFMPASIEFEIIPWLLWNGMIRVPCFWEDDVFCLYQDSNIPQPDALAAAALRSRLKVFAFHPIHVFLNTEHLGRYERTRHLHYKPGELIKHRYEGYGARNRLLSLLSFAEGHEMLESDEKKSRPR